MVACLAARGFTVKAVDLNPQNVDAVNRGVPPINEPGLAELMKEAGNRLTATRSIAEAVEDTEATFIVVNTPSEVGGGFSLQYVLPTCEAVGRVLGSKEEFHLSFLRVLSCRVLRGARSSLPSNAPVENVAERILDSAITRSSSPWAR